MRTIKLKRLPDSKNKGAIDYKELLTIILNSPPRHPRTGDLMGFTPDQVRKVGKILDILEVATTEFTLEDADYRLLEVAVNDFRFGTAHANVRTFLNDIRDADQVSIKNIKTKNAKK